MLSRHPLLSISTLAAALTSATLTLTPLSVAAGPWPPETRSPQDTQADYAHALELFRTERHAASFGRLARLADGGHEGAARLALLMATQGQALFGTAWSASAAQQRRWNALVVNSGRRFVPALDTASGE
jgi:hypothetical protein